MALDVWVKVPQNGVVIFTWLLLLNAIWVGKMHCAVRLAVTPKIVRCGGAVEFLGHIFFMWEVYLLQPVVNVLTLYGRYFCCTLSVMSYYVTGILMQLVSNG